LEAGKDCISLRQLFKKAAAFKGIPIAENDISHQWSGPIAEYVLDDQLLAFLADRGIRRRERSDDIFTLSDENPQVEIPGFMPSNCWNFKSEKDGTGRFDLKVTLEIVFAADQRRRGFILFPSATGMFVSPVDRLPNTRLFKALVESGEPCSPYPAVVRELARSEDGTVFVPWANLGRGNIRRLSDLFRDFTGGNPAIVKLADRMESMEIFDPIPHIRHWPIPDPGDEVYIVEHAWRRVLDAWHAQLAEFRESLNV
jgi:hypothetical protein